MKAKYLVAIFIVILVYVASLLYIGEKSIEELLNIVPVFGYVIAVVFETMLILIIIEVLLSVGQLDERVRSSYEDKGF